MSLRKILEEYRNTTELNKELGIDLAHQQILALLPKKISHKDSCDYEAWSCTCGASDFNQAIDEITHNLTKDV